MLNTKLILIEGPPGSGKSTTAQKLADEMSASGIDCQCFLEWSPDHPIPIGDDLHLGEVISTALAREESMLELWRQFARSRQSGSQVTILESRFWQTSVMLLYVAGLSSAGVQESNRRVVELLQVLNPCLIFFTVSNAGAFAARTIQLKDAEWLRAGLPGTWAEHLYAAFENQKWFTQRGLSGQAGMVALLDEWAGVADGLYERIPFPKLKINDPHLDWSAAMRQMRAFLGLAQR